MLSWAKLPPRAPQPLPVPPVRVEWPKRAVATAVGAEDRCVRGVDAKLNTLPDYRRARGLCIRCGEKWSRDHRCFEQVHLHVLQEVWDLCHCDDIEDQESPVADSEDSQLFLTLSSIAVASKNTDSTMQF